MALILNIETATTLCAVAIAKDGQMLACKETNQGYTHAENLTPFIQEVMQQAGCQFHELDAIAVSRGPGSYTGLRIGVSTAKGLCFALDKPLISVNTLQSLTLAAIRKIETNAHDTSRINAEVVYCPMLDARRMEVYCAIYDSSLTEISPVQAKVIDEAAFAELLVKHKVLFFGDGSSKCKELLNSNKNAVFVDDIVPSAQGMAKLAELNYQQQLFEDTAYFEPFYLKEFLIGPKKQS